MSSGSAVTPWGSLSGIHRIINTPDTVQISAFSALTLYDCMRVPLRACQLEEQCCTKLTVWANVIHPGRYRVVRTVPHRMMHLIRNRTNFDAAWRTFHSPQSVVSVLYKIYRQLGGPDLRFNNKASGFRARVSDWIKPSAGLGYLHSAFEHAL